MGELLYLSATASSSNGSDGHTLKGLLESMRRFCRSIELCDDYLRGYYGLKLVSPHRPSLYPIPNPNSPIRRLTPLLDNETALISSSRSLQACPLILRFHIRRPCTTLHFRRPEAARACNFQACRNRAERFSKGAWVGRL